MKRSPSGSDRDSSPPAKKPRVAKPPKALKTERLNLRALNENPDTTFHEVEREKLEKLVEVLRKKRKIVVIAGAGISVSAGSMLSSQALKISMLTAFLVPDFRSSNGLFNTLRTTHHLKSSGKDLFDASVYRDNTATTSFHTMVRELSHLTRSAKPTQFHHMLATLAEEGRLLRLYSQNVDGIDTSLPPLATTIPLNKKGPWPKTIQLHGGLEKMQCSKCGHLSDFEGALFEGPEPPSCTECETLDGVRTAGGLRSHGIGRLRPRMVLYNEFNPDEEAIGAVSAADLRSRPDAVIVVGTSLKVPGIRRLAREMCAVTRGRRDGFTAWINYDPEPVGIEFKDSWDLVVRGACDDVAVQVGLTAWDDKESGEFTFTTTDADKAKKGIIGIKTTGVELKSLPVNDLGTQVPSPGASPHPRNFKISVVIESKSKPKPKQSKLTAAKEKPKKKPGKKPQSDPKTVKNKITNAFTASKSSKQSPKPRKVDSDLFPGLAMKRVSSSDHRNNTDMSLSEVLEIDDSFEASSAPSTPVQENKPYDRHQTISPKGRLPSGMAKLLH
jgi:NAD-dependent histone deacetylase SIR2